MINNICLSFYKATTTFLTTDRKKEYSVHQYGVAGEIHFTDKINKKSVSHLPVSALCCIFLNTSGAYTDQPKMYVAKEG
jgi:hypothetical protein